MKAALSKRVTWLCYLRQQRDFCWGELASSDANEELEEPHEIQCYKAKAAIELQINTNVESFLLVILFVLVNYFVPLYFDHWQITFVMVNRFPQLHKTCQHQPQFLMDNIKLDEIRSKIKWKLRASFTLYFKSYWYLL